MRMTYWRNCRKIGLMVSIRFVQFLKAVVCFIASCINLFDAACRVLYEKSLMLPCRCIAGAMKLARIAKSSRIDEGTFMSSMAGIYNVNVKEVFSLEYDMEGL